MALVFVHGNRYSGNPILSGSESYDARGLREAKLVKEGADLSLFYDGCGTELTDPFWTICLATATNNLEGSITKQGRVLDVGAGGRCIGVHNAKTKTAEYAADNISLTRFLCYKSGTVDRIKTGVLATAKVGIYTDNAGEPDTLLVTGTTTSGTATI